MKEKRIETQIDVEGISIQVARYYSENPGGSNNDLIGVSVPSIKLENETHPWWSFSMPPTEEKIAGTKRIIGPYLRHVSDKEGVLFQIDQAIWDVAGRNDWVEGEMPESE